ncbi:hypothetical protein N8T08_007040 [Aspergillus melleus]|uniref:Uncharacterized protein n=1 Tax=Aspergillus melleus TaxID=138277 RepID=A0ACC3AZA0_9EURO|nr:hypothetical protein N8T08_007040 [Aspergillus melleus]
MPCLEVLSTEAELNTIEEAKRLCFIKHLARYFARCWSRPRPVEDEVRADCQTRLGRRLTKLKNVSPSILSPTKVLELEHSLPTIFEHTYPQILTHNDLSQTNILISEKTLEITGIVDWSLAGVLPFGMELDSLLLATGYMDLSGWHDYTCRLRLLDACGMSSGLAAGFMILYAAKIGAVLRHAFQRNADGSPSEELTTSKWALKTLDALLLG